MEKNPLRDGPQTHMEIDGRDGITMEAFRERARQLGAEGEMSPNLAHLLTLNTVITTWNHTHGTVTDTDALVILGNARLGVRDGNRGVSDQMIAVRGCQTDICRLAQQLFMNNPTIRHAFEAAAALVQNGTPVFDEEQLAQILEIHQMMRP